MDFFKLLAEKFPDVNLRITIMGKNGKITVAVVPGTKENNIRPITATGTPEELDNEFLAAIEKPIIEAGMTLQNVNEMAADIKALEDEAKKKKEDKQAAGKKKETPAKSEPKSKTEKVKKPAPEKVAVPEKPKEPVATLF